MHRFAMDHAPDPIFWVDESKRLIYVNNAAYESLGYSREELLRKEVEKKEEGSGLAKPHQRWD